ncbi:MAG: hypothetical protein WA874_01125 [Chryseosolibacter sp.]
MIRRSYRILLTVTIVIPLCVFVVMVPYSLLIGWSLVTASVFWLLVFPAVTLYLCSRFLRDDNSDWMGMIAMASFYLFMALMSHWNNHTDFYTVMTICVIYNMSIMGLILLTGKASRHRKAT